MKTLPLVVLRGGGDLATGVGHRLFMAGFPVVVLELVQPRMVRRTVCFAEAVYEGEWVVEGVRARRMDEPTEPGADWVPVLVDPDGACIERLKPSILVDARMMKDHREASGPRVVPPGEAGSPGRPLVVGLGPGFEAGVDAHYVVETWRGHELGRVISRGSALPDTGVPGRLGGESARRVVKAPSGGVFRTRRRIGALVREGDVLGRVGDRAVLSEFPGLLRGLLHDGLEVRPGEKLADVDPRGASVDVHTISDKSRAVGGGVLEAVMRRLWGVDRTGLSGDPPPPHQAAAAPPER